MKYLVSWTIRGANNTLEENRRAMAVFSKWTPDPSITFHQFVQRTDGRGGYAVVETENGAAMLRDALTFGQWFDFSAEPVIDITDAMPVQQEVLELMESITA